MRTRSIMLVLGAVAALVLALALPRAVGGPSPAEARVGGRPPPFTLPAATGGPSSGRFRMSEHLGERPVVILFWATWCQPCQQELPFYQAMYERYRDDGLRIVAISMDSQATVMRAGPAARRLGVEFDVVTDLDTRVTTQLNPRRAAPFSIWVDRNGRITRESEGFSPAEQGALARGLAELVGD
ncbi:MAG TPA: TlpA disulfide reductase family protein [Sandaracinaceae bacterium LLY-WYZ-13_1]|nr:TlpA disulfide reductase family protein [Sandaracinaceae bacterium LLY-WYZ-13_1]